MVATIPPALREISAGTVLRQLPIPTRVPSASQATIPSETVDPHHHATVLGLAMGACEILGGVFGPPVAGALNDTLGVDSFLWMLMVLAVISGFVSMGLRETAPAALARKGLQPQVA